MNDIFSTITGMATNAYIIAGFIALISIPGRMIFRALHGRAPL